MDKQSTWMKLPAQQKLEYGFWVVTVTLCAVIATLFGIILKQNQDRNEVDKRIIKAVSNARIKDSIEIDRLQKRNDQKDEKLIEYLEKKEKIFTSAVEQLDKK